MFTLGYMQNLWGLFLFSVMWKREEKNWEKRYWGVSKAITSSPILLSWKSEAELQRVDILKELDQYWMLLKFSPSCMFVCTHLSLCMYACIVINVSLSNKHIHAFLLSACFSWLAHSRQNVSNLGHFCPPASFPVQCDPN